MAGLLLVMSNCGESNPSVARPGSAGATAQGGAGGGVASALAKFRSLLAHAAEDENLVVEIEQRDGEFAVLLEDGTELVVPEGAVARIIESPENWSVRFEFVDGSADEAGFLGDAFVIDSLELNPYETAPLTAQIKFVSPVGGRVVATVVGRDGEESDVIGYPTPLETHHEVVVLGLYPAYDNTVELTFTREDGTPRITQTLEILTEELPEDYQEFSVEIPYQETVPKGVGFLVNASSLGALLFVDVFGRVRHVLDAGPGAKRGVIQLENGNLAFGDQQRGVIEEYAWSGELINSWTLDATYARIHHDVVEKPDGNFLVTVNEATADTIEDVIVELNRETGDIIRVWDLKDLLQRDRVGLIEDERDWVHVNAITYDPSDESMIVSTQRQGVFKLNADSELEWILSPHDRWDDTFLPYLLELEDGAAPPWGQHSPELMPNGNLLVFDNGLGRDFAGTQQYSRIVEYEVSADDSQGGTVREVFSYGADRPELYSPILSDVDYLPDSDHRVLVSGALAANVEYDGPDAYALTWDYAKTEKARIVEVGVDGEVHFEMIATAPTGQGVIYRAEKMRLGNRASGAPGEGSGSGDGPTSEELQLCSEYCTTLTDAALGCATDNCRYCEEEFGYSCADAWRAFLQCSSHDDVSYACTSNGYEDVATPAGDGACAAEYCDFDCCFNFGSPGANTESWCSCDG